MINKCCRPVLFIFLFFLCIKHKAYCNEVDSLKKLLATTVQDTTRVNLLNELSKQ